MKQKATRNTLWKVSAVLLIIVIAGMTFSFLVPIQSKLAVKTNDTECIGFSVEPTIKPVRYHLLTGQYSTYHRLIPLPSIRGGCDGAQIPQKAELFL